MVPTDDVRAEIDRLDEEYRDRVANEIDRVLAGEASRYFLDKLDPDADGSSPAVPSPLLALEKRIRAAVESTHRRPYDLFVDRVDDYVRALRARRETDPRRAPALASLLLERLRASAPPSAAPTPSAPRSIDPAARTAAPRLLPADDGARDRATLRAIRVRPAGPPRGSRSDPPGPPIDSGPPARKR